MSPSTLITFRPGQFNRDYVSRLLTMPRSERLRLSVEDEARDSHGRWTDSGGGSELFEGIRGGPKPHTAADRAADVENDAARIAATRHTARSEVGTFAERHVNSKRDYAVAPVGRNEMFRRAGAGVRGGTIREQEAGTGGTRSGKRQDQQEPGEKFPRERERGAAAELANSRTEHADAADYHDKMQNHVDENSHSDDQSHGEAAEAHRVAIKSLRAKARDVGGGVDSKRAREASKVAHREPDPMDFSNLLSADLPRSMRLRLEGGGGIPRSQMLRLGLSSSAGGPPQTGSKGDWGIFRDIGGEPYGAGKATMPANEVARLHKTIASHEKEAKGHQSARDNAKVRGKADEAKEHHEAGQEHIDAATEGQAAEKSIPAPKTAAEHKERANDHYVAAEKAARAGDAEGHAKHFEKGHEHAGKAKAVETETAKREPAPVTSAKEETKPTSKAESRKSPAATDLPNDPDEIRKQIKDSEDKSSQSSAMAYNAGESGDKDESDKFHAHSDEMRQRANDLREHLSRKLGVDHASSTREVFQKAGINALGRNQQGREVAMLADKVPVRQVTRDEAKAISAKDPTALFHGNPFTGLKELEHHGGGNLGQGHYFTPNVNWASNFAGDKGGLYHYTGSKVNPVEADKPISGEQRTALQSVLNKSGHGHIKVGENLEGKLAASISEGAK